MLSCAAFLAASCQSGPGEPPEIEEPEDQVATTYAGEFGEGERLIVPLPSDGRELLIEVRRSSATSGEDGRGAMIDAIDPIEFAIDGRAFGTRSVPPALSLGALRFVSPQPGEAGSLIYVVADRAALPAEGELALAVAARRFVIDPAFSLPAEL